jgi:hypothetical protein
MSELRELTRPVVNIAHVKPAGRPPRLDFLPLSQMRIDDAYQRRIEGRGLQTIVRICNEFDWRRFTPVIVARIAGKQELYAVIDGQHRATAALLRGFDKVPCAILDASALEQPAIFAAINGNVTPVTIFQLFKAARAAKAEWALDIDEACATGGIVPLLYPKPKSTIRPFETMAIGTLRRSIMRFGKDQVGAAIKAVRAERGADEPGFWRSSTIDRAVFEYRSAMSKPVAEAQRDGVTVAQRIRELKKRGHTRFAIQTGLGVKLSEIEEALRGEA